MLRARSVPLVGCLAIVLVSALGCGGAADDAPTESVASAFGVYPTGWFALQASNGRYVSANYGGYVVANRTAIGPWEKFYITYLYSSESYYQFALVASNNQIVSADLNRGGRLIANRNGVGPWEEFLFTNLSCCVDGGHYTIEARSTGKYVSADRTIGDVLIANRTNWASWEEFYLIPVSPP